MIVRIKKRGEWPHPTGPVFNLFRGCCLEVMPTEGNFSQYGCTAKLFEITDHRYLSLVPEIPGVTRCVCQHYLIDDLDAFDSDFCDEDAKEGDLAFAQIPTFAYRGGREEEIA